MFIKYICTNNSFFCHSLQINFIDDFIMLLSMTIVDAFVNNRPSSKLDDYNLPNDIFNKYVRTNIELGKFNKKKSNHVFPLLLMIETFPSF